MTTTMTIREIFFLQLYNARQMATAAAAVVAVAVTTAVKSTME
jgi:hypothetical protein